MSDSYPKIKVAAVQDAPVFLNREASVKKACQIIKEAGANGAKIVVFPEGFLPAFPYWFYFYPAGDPKCKAWNLELFKNSIEVPSRETDELCLAAKEAGCYVVMGINEKEPGTLGTMYNTQLFIHRAGYIIGKHRKLVPTATERLVHHGGDGSTLVVADTEYGGIGGLICGENINPLARFMLYSMGERIHAAGWPAFNLAGQPSLETIDIRMKYYAIEGQVFVISSTWVFSEEMKEIMCLSKEVRERMRGDGGHASIIAPGGGYVTAPTLEGAGIVYGEIDIEQIIAAKIKQDIIGHYNRFDVFSLNFNSLPQRAIREMNKAPLGNCPSENWELPGEQPDFDPSLTPPEK